ncbi:MAG: hypothetical protein ABR503_04075 [Chitinophagaceae bacterium]
MNSHGNNKIENLNIRYNLVPISIGVLFNLAPTFSFWLTGHGKLIELIVFLLVSSIPAFLTNSFVDKLQISENTNLYKTMGVDRFKKYAASGDLINHQIRKKYPKFRQLMSNRSMEIYLLETYKSEKIHYVLLLFCFFTSASALLNNVIFLLILIMSSNLLFNVYPIFLQQSNRLRIKMYLKKKTNRNSE